MTVEVSLDGSHFQLSNGLEVALHEEHDTPVVRIGVRYHVGSKDDPEGRSGLSHLCEHLTFSATGAARRPLDQELDESGVLSFNGRTGRDWTQYEDVLQASYLERGLALEAERMRRIADPVAPETIAHELGVVEQERRERNVPLAAHIDDVVRTSLFGSTHPYRRPIVGERDELARTTVADVQTFARRYYGPSNATLVVVGDFDSKEARGIIERHFGKLHAGPLLEPRYFTVPRPSKDERFVFEANVPAPTVLITWAIPPRHVRGWEEVHIGADLVTEAIREELRGEVVHAEVDAGRLGSTLRVSIELSQGTDPKVAEAAVEHALRRATSTPTRRNLAVFDHDDRRTKRATAELVELSNARGRLNRIQDDLEMFGRIDAVRESMTRLQAVTLDDTKAAVQDLLVDAGKVVVVVIPTPNAPAEGKLRR